MRPAFFAAGVSHVSAPLKRRRASYYWSLPVIVAIVFLLAVQLVAMQRAAIIAELSERAAHQEPAEASDAVRELGAMAHPPAKVLVDAAVSLDRAVAAEGQRAIDKWLARSQSQINATRNLKSVARQLTELAEALAARHEGFASADQFWLANTTQRIVHLANEMPTKHAPLVAVYCDEILAAIPPEYWAKTADASSHAHQANNDPAPTTDMQSAKSDAAGASTVAAQAAPAVPAAEENVVTHDPSQAIDSSWRMEWSRPVFRIFLAPTTNMTPGSEIPIPSTLSPENFDEPPSEMELMRRPMAHLDVRALLQDWLAATGNEAIELERELATRGFKKLPKAIVTNYFADQREVRVQVVDDILAESGIDARPWLMLLADDADVEVRLAAMTIMATSTDRMLVEKAWQTALHDRDPRIAALANRLRDRRAATQRR